MRILVTGASGYIGSYLIRWLSARRADFGAVSRRKPDYLEAVLGAAPYYEADIESLASLKVHESYDVLVHLASANDIDSADPRNALLTTGFGARLAIDFCQANSIPRMIYFSTFQVYGTNEGTVNETTPTRSRNDYALTHLVGEEYVKLAQQRDEIAGIIFRPTNIYGAPLASQVDRWSLVPGCFCKEAHETGKITLQSSGNQVRDFISLEDISQLTYLFCERFDTWKNQVINLPSGHVKSIHEAAEMTASIYEELTGRKCPITRLSDQPEKKGSLVVDTSKLDGLPYFCEDTMEAVIRKTFNLLG
jgi:UDP-glucose 4-epimerase